MFADIWRDKYCQELEGYKISFQNDLDFKKQEQVIHVTTVGGDLLRIIQIYNAVRGDKTKTLFVNLDDEVQIQNQIVQSFELPTYIYLIIIWARSTKESATTNIYSKLENLLKVREYKKIILVGESSIQPAQEIGLKVDLQLNDSITFEDLSDNSRNELLKSKHIKFQGEVISLKELFAPQMAEAFPKLLDSETLEKLVRGQEVKIGERYSNLEEDTFPYYVDRTFLRTKGSTEGKRCNKENEDEFSEESICEIREKMILIADGAGTGKTTVLDKLAVTIKKKYPHLWIVRINLNEYTKILKNCQENNIQTISVTELMDSQEATKMTSKFESSVFFMSEKIVLMLDGVDEVSPNYTDLIRNLLIQCRQASNFAKILITTRPYVAEKMEGIIDVSFKLLPFTSQNQIDFLAMYWAKRLKLDNTKKVKCEIYARTLIQKIPSWIKSCYRQNNFTEMPLHLRMIAEIFQENTEPKGCMEYINEDEPVPALPEKFNISKLYDIFIEKKRNIFVNKGNPNGNVLLEQALTENFEKCLGYHRSVALKEICEKQAKLFPSCQPDNEDIESCALKIGILQKPRGKLQFLHRTLAEYFTAQTVSEELQNQAVDFQRFIIDELLVNDEFEIVRRFLNNFLSKSLNSLPATLFNDYRRKCRNNRTCSENIVFVLSREGCANILHLILKSINFETVRSIKIGMMNFLNKTNWKSNTLNDLRVAMRRFGVDIRDDKGNTPLHYAAERGHLEMVEFLIQLKADINSKNQFGYTVLHLAVEFRQWNTVKCLLESGADVNNKGSNDRTALHLAITSGDLDIVKYLVGQNADIDSKDSTGRTALYIAVELGYLSIVKYLVDQGADTNSKDNNGRAVLHLAVRCHNIDVVTYLVENKADIDSEDNCGSTAMNLATESGNLDVIRYLARHIDMEGDTARHGL